MFYIYLIRKMDSKKDYYEKSVKPILEALTFQVVCDMPDNLVLLINIGNLYDRLASKNCRIY
jgi:hypothetical protein